MAQRYFIKERWGLLKGHTSITMRVLMSGTTPVLQAWQYPTINNGTTGSYATAGSTSSPQGGMGSASLGAEGVKSVTRTGAGLWTVVLQDNYNRLVGIRGHQSLAGGLSTIIAFGENTTISNMTSAGGSTIGLALLSATATAADPATTTSVTITFELQNSTAP